MPLVDCSPSIGHFEMTEVRIFPPPDVYLMYMYIKYMYHSYLLLPSQDEVELCSLTSQFEDFVLQFLDRCIYRKSKESSLAPTEELQCSL